MLSARSRKPKPRPGINSGTGAILTWYFISERERIRDEPFLGGIGPDRSPRAAVGLDGEGDELVLVEGIADVELDLPVDLFRHPVLIAGPQVDARFRRTIVGTIDIEAALSGGDREHRIADDDLVLPTVAAADAEALEHGFVAERVVSDDIIAPLADFRR